MSQRAESEASTIVREFVTRLSELADETAALFSVRIRAVRLPYETRDSATLLKSLYEATTRWKTLNARLELLLSLELSSLPTQTSDTSALSGSETPMKNDCSESPS